MALHPFVLNQVRLLEGPLLDAQTRNGEYLLSLEPDRMLRSFRVNAGLQAPGEPLGGWEAPACEVRGHFFGHYLSACALMYASTHDGRFKERGSLLVSELARCQKALGGKYLSAYPESFLDRLESLTQLPWAPYYTLHKIMAGLYDQYLYAENAQALEILKGMADYFSERTEKYTHEELNRILDRSEEGGICEAFWNLYSVTGDPKHRALAEKYEKSSFLDPLARGEDNLTHRHGNTHIPLVVGAARRYELTGDTQYLALASFFWDRVVRARSYATGGSTDAEIWGEPFKLAQALSTSNHETCKTYNMLRLTRHLLCLTGNPLYADYYERAFWNGILGTQDPATGMLEYYVPQMTGCRRVYGTPTDSFWCCYGTGIESYSKLGDSIYFHDSDGILVNLFIPSEVDWKEKGVRLTQTTRFPEEQGISLEVHAKEPTQFVLKIHIPHWADQGVQITVNGSPLEVHTHPSSFFSIDRVWRDGDRVRIKTPMRLYTVPMPDDPNLVAYAYGPVVLGGVLSGESKTLYSKEPNPAQTDAPGDDGPCLFLADDPSDVSFLEPVGENRLMFQTKDQPLQVTFRPFYQIIGERYGLYWPVVPEGSGRQKELIRLAEEKRLVFGPDPDGEIDRVYPGDEASEQAHHLVADRSVTGVHLGRKWRHAEGGWSWTLAVLPDHPTRLKCVYWGADQGREFDVLVEDRVIATEKLEGKPGPKFSVVQYAIPEDLTHGRNEVKVTFRCKTGYAGGVFGCSTVRMP
jgi:hypothetical protein